MPTVGNISFLAFAYILAVDFKCIFLPSGLLFIPLKLSLFHDVDCGAKTASFLRSNMMFHCAKFTDLLVGDICNNDDRTRNTWVRSKNSFFFDLCFDHHGDDRNPSALLTVPLSLNKTDKQANCTYSLSLFHDADFGTKAANFLQSNMIFY